jgi:hypothetical protein
MERVTETRPRLGRRDKAARLGVPPKRARVARLRASHSYGFVLGVVLGSLLYAALAPDGRFAVSFLVVLETVTLVTALWTAGLVPLRSTPVATLLAVAVIAALLPLFFGSDAFSGMLALVNAALVAAAMVSIGQGAIDQGEVNLQSLRAVIAIYLLLGMFFVFLYGAAAALGDGPFFAQGIDGDTSLRLYFSFVTLATLGYGDYTPAGDLGHLLAIVEALLGQLYLVTVVALVVTQFGRHRGAPPE